MRGVSDRYVPDRNGRAVRRWLRGLWRALTGAGPQLVFLSHTAELRGLPAERSFIAAAEGAVIRAGHAVTDMAYFAARDTRPADYCRRMVARADVYVGVIGHRYGSVVPGQPEQSYTELEFETATSLRLPRLVFLLEDADAAATAGGAIDPRQREFRRQLREAAGVIVATVRTPNDLELQLLHSLVELRTAGARPALLEARRWAAPSRAGSPAAP